MLRINKKYTYSKTLVKKHFLRGCSMGSNFEKYLMQKRNFDNRQETDAWFKIKLMLHFYAFYLSVHRIERCTVYALVTDKVSSESFYEQIYHESYFIIKNLQL